MLTGLIVLALGQRPMPEIEPWQTREWNPAADIPFATIRRRVEPPVAWLTDPAKQDALVQRANRAMGIWRSDKGNAEKIYEATLASVVANYALAGYGGDLGSSKFFAPLSLVWRTRPPVPSREFVRVGYIYQALCGAVPPIDIGTALVTNRPPDFFLDIAHAHAVPVNAARQRDVIQGRVRIERLLKLYPGNRTLRYKLARVLWGEMLVGLGRASLDRSVALLNELSRTSKTAAGRKNALGVRDYYLMAKGSFPLPP